MRALENIDALIERLTEKVDGLLAEREAMVLEIERLRACLDAKDEEAVRMNRKMQGSLEALASEALLWERRYAQAESGTRGLNDRLIELAERCCGGR